MILDSPLNKAGKLKALYVHTNKNVLIQVNPQVRAGQGGSRHLVLGPLLWPGAALGPAHPSRTPALC